MHKKPVPSVQPTIDEVASQPVVSQQPARKSMMCECFFSRRKSSSLPGFDSSKDTPLIVTASKVLVDKSSEPQRLRGGVGRLCGLRESRSLLRTAFLCLPNQLSPIPRNRSSPEQPFFPATSTSASSPSPAAKALPVPSVLAPHRSTLPSRGCTMSPRRPSELVLIKYTRLYCSDRLFSSMLRCILSDVNDSNAPRPSTTEQVIQIVPCIHVCYSACLVPWIGRLY